MGKIRKGELNPIEAVSFSKVEIDQLSKKLTELKISKPQNLEKFAFAVKQINPNALVPIEKLPEDVRTTLEILKNETKRFHGAKIALSWFPFPMRSSPCNDKFGYLTSNTVRQSSKLDMNPIIVNLLNQLGGIMGDPSRDVGPDSTIPAGYTYFGQFVDHDITLDVSSDINNATDATSINNMRTPALDLDNIYGRGPALSPYLYEFPSSGPSTAIKLKLGKNINVGKGGPSTNSGGIAGMAIKTDADVPRVEGTNTAIIGDPRNDENLFVAQFQMAMLKFHNKVIDIVVASGFTGDIFVEAKKIVTHHYQWAVVNDFLKRICGASVVSNSLTSVAAPVGSSFSMPVEFSVAAYRFGHSLIRDRYWINHNFINQPLSDAFNFIRNPNLPVFSNWVVDFNAFFQTGINVPVFNFARKIDSFLANGLESLPGGSGIMAMLAARNLRRGLAMGLPSGQATAAAFGITPMTTAQLTSGLPANEVALLNSNGGILLNKTPLWYYILREASVLNNGNTLGPLGAKIVADTFIRILKRDSESYLNKLGGFTPFLPSDVLGDFTVTDIIKVSEVNIP
ncbi:MAG: heme peroxidase family protein [Limnohabitans sp.]|nr:heme peroxidase family protein [Limnohabitans sp.]